MSEDASQILQACPSCATLMDVTDEAPFSQTYCPSCGQSIRARSQFNNFLIQEILGEGGMGSVFKALDQNLHRMVALKILKKECSANAEERQRLETEARLTASINHPHVVKLYSFGQDHGQFYMAMELVEKGSLDDLIGIQQRVAEAQVLEVGIQIAQGLEAASERGLIHRDVKPGNILFADPHTAKIVDFGLAAPISGQPGDGEIWGTPYYIAPEKLNNEPEDFRSDMYSLGGTLFHALAGRPPFEAQTASLVALKHIKSQAVSLHSFAPDVSSETAYVINRTLAKEPDDRYQSYVELIEHLQYARTKLLEKAGSKRRRPERVVVESQRQRQIGGLFALILLLVGAGVLFAFRDQIIPQKDDALTAAAEEQMVDEIALDGFAEARKAIIEGQYNDAMSQLENVGETPGLQAPLRNWIELNRGLAATLGGQDDIASEIFQKFEQDGLYGATEEERGRSSLFFNIGRAMSTDRPVSPSVVKSYSAENYEVLALLFFGIKNWHLGKFAEAVPFLEAFAKANPTGAESSWIIEYQPLVDPFLADYTAYRQIRNLVDSASDPASASAVLKALETTRNQLRSGSRMTEEFENLQRNLEEKGAQ